jgi:hypothetical protein
VASETAVHVAPVRDADDHDAPVRIVDLVDDPSVADSHAVVAAAGELGRAVRTRLGGE